MIEFTVFGKPVAQGSKKVFLVKGQPRMKEAAEGHGSWRNEVSEAALNAKEEYGLDEPLTGPLRLSVTFRFPMPKSRSKADKERGIKLKVTSPDLGKLLRSVEDSLTAAGLIKDDALIVSYDGSIKLEVWEEWTGAYVQIRRLSDE